MITLYWGIEYAKVVLCYLFILFIWPSVVFRKYLRNKSIIFRFCFCATTQIVLINTAVLGLGLVHLLNPWVINILFYGSLLFSFRKSLIPTQSLRRDLRKLITGTLSLRGFTSTYLSRFTSCLRKMFGNLWRLVRSHLLEYAVLSALVVYGVMYFSYSPFMDHSYGFGDMYTHHSWIYGLIQGQVFSAGVYPEGMHCVVYMMHTVTGLPVYNCNLFLGCIHVAVYILAAYCLMREIFRWRGTPFVVLTIFLVVAVNSYDMVISMARLQRSLPGEYGLHTVFICALFLLRFLKEDIQKGWYKHPREWLKNENLLVFSMSLAASIAVHFYVTITAFFVCLGFALVYFVRALSPKRFLPLVAAVLCGVIISVLPMAGALLSGIPFQGSIGWALSVMGGDDEETSAPDQVETGTSGMETTVPETPGTALPGTELPGAEQPSKTFDWSEFLLRLEGMRDTLKEKSEILYRRGYSRLFGDATVGTWVIRISVLSAAFWLVFRLTCMLIKPLRGAAGTFDNYLPTIVASFLIIILYSAPALGLPELIAYIRLPSTAYILLLMVAAMPVDILFSAPQRFFPNWLMQMVSVACVAAICVATPLTGRYHGYFYNELTRYRAAVNVTSSIIESFPQYSYTIVSSTDELYSVIQYGRHEELLDFLKSAERSKSYYLPTEYVFIYVEKNPIQHAQYHYSSGPAWLGTDTYADRNLLNTRTSKYPEIFATHITEDDANWNINIYPTAYSSYRNSLIRTIINAKADKWCRDFADLYDHEMKIYYEDDDFICYYFRQNTYSLYDLAIWN